jgi:hypothetical protein
MEIIVSGSLKIQMPGRTGSQIVDKMFRDRNDRSHFLQLSIRKGTDRLDLWTLGQGGFLTGQAESPGSHGGSQHQ